MVISYRALTDSVLFVLWFFVSPLSVYHLAAAPIYSYTDDTGILNFTTEFDSIPEKYRNQLSRHDFEPPTASPAPVVTESPVPPAAFQVVTASGEYRMGHHDTRESAVHFAVEAAKKDALEQVATYLESVTEVRNMDVTRDDLRTFTAGIVRVLNERITTRLEDDAIVIRADLTAEIDPHQVAQAISALRQNESARQELMALRAETDQLQRQLDEANHALASAASPEEVQRLNEQRQDMLNELQANALVSQAWTNWAYATPGIYSYSWIGLPGINGLLLQAQRLSPQHRHLPFAYQTITTGIGTVPPIPPGSTSATRSSLLVPSSSYPVVISPPSYRMAPGSSGVKHSAPVRTPAPAGVPTTPHQSSSPSSQPSPYQLHPSHFWRPSSPNIHTAPSVSTPNPSIAPKSSGGFSGHSGGGGGYFGGNGGGGRFGGGATGSGRGR